MSTVRRLFDHPRNTEVVNGRARQVCCDGNAPYWDTYRIYDDKDAWASRDSERNMPATKTSDSMLVQDDTGASDKNVYVEERDINGKLTGSNDQMKGYVRVEGPKSGYRPEFLPVDEWMAWQGVEYSADPRGVKMADGSYNKNLPNPPRWRRTRIRTDKMKWGKGPGGWASYGHTFLWCQKCETNLEAAWSKTLDALPVAARGVAMIVSYVPVIGTAVSFVINTSVTLAEGGTIDQALVDGIGGALPGQPTSGIVFRTAIAIAQGQPVDYAFIDGIIPDKTLREAVKTALDIFHSILKGESITNAVLDSIQKRMPPKVQTAMNYARRIINGENVAEMVLSEGEKMVVSKVRAEASRIVEEARSKGEAALNKAKAEAQGLLNQYVAESAYQFSLAGLDVAMRDALQTGLVVGVQKVPTSYSFGTVAEKNVAVNETYLQKGQRLINEGLKYRGKLVSEMLKGTFTLPIEDFDSLNNRWRVQNITFKPVGNWASNEKQNGTAAFNRGFAIGIGVCTGSSQRGPGQTAVYQTMAEKGGRDGFDAGQAVAWDITKNGSGLVAVSNTISATKATSVMSLIAEMKPAATVKKNVMPFIVDLKPAAPKVVMPTMVAKKEISFFSATSTPGLLTPDQKKQRKDQWVTYYNQLNPAPPGSVMNG